MAIESRFATTITEVAGGVVVITLSGQLDAHTAPEFERFLEQTIRGERKTKIVLDFGPLEYIASAGLGVLMGFIEEVRGEGGDIKFAAVPEKIFHVLDLLGFPVVFDIKPTVEETTASFGA
jgi:anti-sigma B factor antagonist